MSFHIPYVLPLRTSKLDLLSILASKIRLLLETLFDQFANFWPLEKKEENINIETDT